MQPNTLKYRELNWISEQLRLISEHLSLLWKDEKLIVCPSEKVLVELLPTGKKSIKSARWHVGELRSDEGLLANKFWILVEWLSRVESRYVALKQKMDWRRRLKGSNESVKSHFVALWVSSRHFRLWWKYKCKWNAERASAVGSCRCKFRVKSLQLKGFMTSRLFGSFVEANLWVSWHLQVVCLSAVVSAWC